MFFSRLIGILPLFDMFLTYTSFHLGHQLAGGFFYVVGKIALRDCNTLEMTFSSANDL